jgi:hypothetical protein
MTSAWIVKAVDVLEESRVDLPSGLPAVAPDKFGLHRIEERFDCDVVVAIALATHRDCEAVLVQRLLVVVRTILGGFKRSSQHRLCPPTGANRQVLLRAFSSPVSFAA